MGWIARITWGRFRRLVARALALNPRGFVPDDVLPLRALSARLRMEWHSRDLHPWDRGLPAGTQRARLLDQTLRDTDEAVARVFVMLPEVEAIEVRVLEPAPAERLVLSGTVTREDALAAGARSSVRMRLQMMGIRCHADDARLQSVG